MISANRIKTLVLTLAYAHRASYYDDWCDAFLTSSEFDCTVRNIIGLPPAKLQREIEEYDVIVLLHSCNADTLEFLTPLSGALSGRKSAKLLTFVGNEFNSPYVSMPARTNIMRDIRADIIATQLLREAGEFLYRTAGARVISVPHALNPQAFRPGPDHSRRSLDIGVKGYRYPPYIGDDDRNRLIRYFRLNSDRLRVSVSIGEDKRVDRAQWSRFLADCRGTISTEVGSWYLQPDDALIRRIYQHLQSHRKGFVIRNESSVRRLARRLPMPVKSALWKLLKTGVVKFEVLDDFSTTFDELNELFFKHEQRAPVYSKAISSRHFDAIGSKTCQIMQRGRYNDILVANEHYIAIEEDYSNADEAVCRFRDPCERTRIVEAAYDHVMAGHTYAHRSRYIRAELEKQ